MKHAQIFEAIERLGILTKQGLHVEVIQKFIDENILFKSVRQTINFKISDENEKGEKTGKKHIGTLYFLDEDEKKVVDDFEDKNGALVYLVEKSDFEFGTCLSLFYISKYREEWEIEKEEMTDSCIICSYVKNLDDDNFSEFGCIMYELFGGEVLRTS